MANTRVAAPAPTAEEAPTWVDPLAAIVVQLTFSEQITASLELLAAITDTRDRWVHEAMREAFVDQHKIIVQPVDCAELLAKLSALRDEVYSAAAIALARRWPVDAFSHAFVLRQLQSPQRRFALLYVAIVFHDFQPGETHSPHASCCRFLSLCGLAKQ